MPQAVYDNIVAHAREGKPEEICGIVRGRGLTAYAAVRGPILPQSASKTMR